MSALGLTGWVVAALGGLIIVARRVRLARTLLDPAERLQHIGGLSRDDALAALRRVALDAPAQVDAALAYQARRTGRTDGAR
jgi:hypothetical protein